MSLYERGGHPQHFNSVTAVNTMQQWDIGGPTMRLEIDNVHATEALEVFLTNEARMEGAGGGTLIQPGYGRTWDVELYCFWTLTTNAGSFRSVMLKRP